MQTTKEDGALPTTTTEELVFTASPAIRFADETIQQTNVCHSVASLPISHPTTARKTISPQMLAALEAAAAVNNDPDSDLDPDSFTSAATIETPTETKGNLTRIPLNSFVEGEILYHYHVIRSDFGPNIVEANAITTVFGPYYTLPEANESAKMEAGRSYAEMFVAAQLEGRRAYLGKEEGVGSEIGIVSDGLGCQTWRCVSMGGKGVVAKVERGELTSHVF